MKFVVLTTFPEIFPGPLASSIIGKAIEKELVQIDVINLRDFTSDAHRTTDDRPYGGGPGMVMMIEPIDKALDSIKAKKGTSQESIILTSAKGVSFTQHHARSFSSLDRVVIICGHYEGVDERVAKHLVDLEVRLGDAVVTGGEIPAMMMIDAVGRLVQGVVGKEESLSMESHNVEGVGEYPQFTRPSVYKGWTVPDVLLQGNHADIQAWRTHQLSDLNKVESDLE